MTEVLSVFGVLGGIFVLKPVNFAMTPRIEVGEGNVVHTIGEHVHLNASLICGINGGASIGGVEVYAGYNQVAAIYPLKKRVVIVVALVYYHVRKVVGVVIDRTLLKYNVVVEGILEWLELRSEGVKILVLVDGITSLSLQYRSEILYYFFFYLTTTLLIINNCYLIV